MRRGLLAILALVTVGTFGCRRIRPEDRVDGWALARTTLTNGSSCFAGRPEYCLTDPEFVDAAVRPRLDGLYGGEMPPRKIHVEAVVRAAELEYKKRSTSPDNVRRIEELVRERYHNPKLSVVGDEVVIDMGVVPGPLEVVQSTHGLRMRRSAEVEAGGYRPAELSRVIALAAAHDRTRSRVRVEVLLPMDRGELTPFTYRYDRSDHRIIVYSGGEAMSSPRFQEDPPPPTPFASFTRCIPSRDAKLVGAPLEECAALEGAPGGP